MSPVLIAREPRLPGCVGDCGQGDEPCKCPERCAEMAGTAGDDDAPLTRAEQATLMLIYTASVGLVLAAIGLVAGWLVG